MKPLVMSSRLGPWRTSWFVLAGDRLIARDLTWSRAIHLARALSA